MMPISSGKLQQKIGQGTEYENAVLPVLDPRFECSICLNCLKDPLLTKCGHRFCKTCIYQWIKVKGGVCPIDGLPLSLESDLFPDNYTRREISQQRVRCPVEDCTEVLPLSDAEQHVSQCHQNGEHENLECTYNNVGCEFVAGSLIHLKMHLETNLQDHLALVSSVCSGLSTRIATTRNSFKSKAEEAKFWDPTPKQKDTNDDQNAKGSSEQDGLKELVRDLYERIVLLEQRSREQEIQLNSTKQQMAKLLIENEVMKSDLPLRVCGGEYIWTITDFPNKLRAMKEKPSTLLFSSGFYTSYHGYRFCGRLNLKPRDTNYLALLVHLMEGDNDSTLDWPFSGRISLTLFHPVDRYKTIRETMMSRPELDAFRRPVKVINALAFGYADFISTMDIEDYLKDNCLTIKIQIKTV